MRLRYSIPVALLALALAAPSAIASTGFSAVLNGLAEVPPNVSPASGTGVCVLNNTQTQLSYSVSYSGLTANRTASHFHGPAAVGANAGVIFGIAAGGPTSDTIVGVWNLSATNVTQLFGGLVYLNVHSSTFPGGEIRGQVNTDVTPNQSTSWGRIKSLYR